LHFNKKREKNTNTMGSGIFGEENFNMYRLLAIDTITIDQYSRLTLTNEVKNVLNIEARDKNMGIDYNKKKSSASSIVASISDRKGTDSGVETDTYRPHNKNEIRNIILVDDEQDVLYNFQITLSEEGYNVTPFSKSKEAIKHLIDLNNSSHYDLAIINIRMPELNGIQLYQILKIINKNIKVLFISALDAADEILNMFPEIDSGNIIRKPVSQGYIVSKVKDIISS
jgi:CheY-like chemotaxis protein